MADAVLPGGHGLPGALESGVDLEAALAEPAFARVATLLRNGTTRLEGRTGPLSALTPAARLEALATAVSSDAEFPWTAYRGALVDFTLEAWAGHPLRCGNRAGIVWQSLGLTIRG